MKKKKKYKVNGERVKWHGMSKTKRRGTRKSGYWCAKVSSKPFFSSHRIPPEWDRKRPAMGDFKVKQELAVNFEGEKQRMNVTGVRIQNIP